VPRNEAGQPIVRASLRLSGEISERQVLSHLKAQTPSVVCASESAGEVMVTPMTLEPEEVSVVIEALRRCERDLLAPQ
jgi:hypothetical protein